MKVLIFSDTFLPYVNGVSTRHYNLCKYLLSNGHIIEYCCGVEEPRLPPEIRDSPGFHYHYLSGSPLELLTQRDLPLYFYLPPKVIWMMLKGDYDIIFISYLMLPALLITAFQLVGLLKKPVIFAQEINALRYMDRSAFPYAGSPYLHWIWTQFYCAYFTIFKLLAYLMDNLIVGPSLNVGLYSSTFSPHKKSFKQLPTGISAKFTPSPHLQQWNGKQSLRLLYLGRIGPEKGLHNLGGFLETLRQRRIAFKLTMVGPEEGDFIDYLSKLYERYLNDIEFCGPVVGDDQIMATFHAHHMSIQPSDTESFGLTIFESFACGVPCFYRGNDEVQPFYSQIKAVDGSCTRLEDYSVDFASDPEAAVDKILSLLRKPCPQFNILDWEEASAQTVKLFSDYISDYNSSRE